MSQSATSSAGKTQSPQVTGGFSQMQSRSIGGDTSGQAMSVMLSWHEKVRRVSWLNGGFTC